MIRKITFMIRSNPCESNKPAEAIRIAAGLGTGKNHIRIILSGEAPRVLSPDEEELVDIDIIEKFLPLLKEWDTPVYVDRGSSGCPDPDKSPVSFRMVEGEELPDILGGSHYVFVF